MEFSIFSDVLKLRNYYKTNNICYYCKYAMEVDDQYYDGKRNEQFPYSKICKSCNCTTVMEPYQDTCDLCARVYNKCVKCKNIPLLPPTLANGPYETMMSEEMITTFNTQLNRETQRSFLIELFNRYDNYFNDADKNLEKLAIHVAELKKLLDFYVKFY